MPLYNWRDDRGWDSLHLVWQNQLLEWIQPRLPEGYRVYLGSVPALTIDTPACRPDLVVRNWHPNPEDAVQTSSSLGIMEPDLEAVATFALDP